MKKFKLLNDRQMKPIEGGGESKISNCKEAGDTLYCAPIVGNIVLCTTHEVTCPNGFSVNCRSLGNYSITCPNVTVKPKI